MSTIRKWHRRWLLIGLPICGVVLLPMVLATPRAVFESCPVKIYIALHIVIAISWLFNVGALGRALRHVIYWLDRLNDAMIENDPPLAMGPVSLLDLFVVEIIMGYICVWGRLCEWW